MQCIKGLFTNRHRKYIDYNSLDTDQILKLVDIDNKRVSNNKVAIACVVAAFITADAFAIGAFFIRKWELQTIKQEACNIPQPVIETINNLEKDIHFVANELKSNHNLCSRMYGWSYDVHRKLLPERHERISKIIPKRKPK